MDKESKYLLQKIDCNCSDCKSMVRDIERFKQSLEKHNEWQLDDFNTNKKNLFNKAKEWKGKGFPNKVQVLNKEANKLKFQFDKKQIAINYGKCTKKNKDVTFIPNTCQLETQDCFEHRLDIGE